MANIIRCLFIVIFLLKSMCSWAQVPQLSDFNSERLTKDIHKLMRQGKIPGLTLVLIKDSNTVTKHMGVIDINSQVPVSGETIFQTDAASGPFVGFLVDKLANAGTLDLKKKISDYLPWFQITYKERRVDITLEQLLYHTSGISPKVLLPAPEIDRTVTPEELIKDAAGVTLDNPPGTVYKPAKFNYDLLILVIEKVTGKSYATNLREKIFADLAMNNTTVGDPGKGQVAGEHKIGFFSPRPYHAPAFNGENVVPALFTTADDLGKWVLFQMRHYSKSPFDGIKGVQGGTAYANTNNSTTGAMGWDITLQADGEKRSASYTGPSSGAYIAFSPGRKNGVIVLANSNSKYTAAVGERYLNYLSGGSLEGGVHTEEDSDGFYSMISIVVGLFVAGILFFIGSILYDIKCGARTLKGRPIQILGKLLLALVIMVPFVYGLYLLPSATANDWNKMIIWSPISFIATVSLMGALLGLSYVAYGLNVCFIQKSKFKQILPMILVLSMFSGVANIIVITLISNAFTAGVELSHMVYYYVLAIAVYLLGRRFVQISLTKYSMEVVYELRTQLVNKIFATSYQKFEAIDRGRVYTSLNNDIFQISSTANTVVVFFGGIFTIVGGFVYLTLLAFWSTILIISVFSIMAVIYYFVTESTTKYFERSRDSENVFMRFVNGMIDGYKEISLHRNKKFEYKSDLAASAQKFRDNMTIANLRYVDVFLVGESLLVVLLGFVVFALPFFFKEIQVEQITGFVIILLYVIAPIENVLGAIPGFIQLKISRKRIAQFLSEIPANLSEEEVPEQGHLPQKVETIRAEGIIFRYKNNDEPNPFTVGPVNLEIKSGEILFIIGGNGSGKTTLSKLLTGLYEADEGHFYINDKPVYFFQLSEHFSASFSPAFLFEKLYNINVEEKREEMKKYLKILHLEDKVKIEGNKYSTIKLSGGQVKRLALLQCYLEDYPIYLFDEWAADQDPEYRNFFYRTLLPDMRAKGKIVIAITHDDHYFDVADKVLKMKQGKLEVYNNNKTMFHPVEDVL
ncbi:cyclic peptide export ABC transporter [Chitinophaga pendula]|uniref:cyclic peptide export ABC transporter n=1 Tax=Chitinophaga TaxID=79328 RepID=UPI000BAE8CBA|nr:MULTISPECIES: cyclic peptide export ABC transporter [Chitinophaga]ASZ13679.1 hypothetical protein CK934_23345 [Chitinophaga sp. MD30]UCJ08704.1 cyclic peptide export ABC transporter [Chitinophaga pendula]